MSDEQLAFDLGLEVPPAPAPTPTDEETIEFLRGEKASLQSDLEELSAIAGEDIRQIALALDLGDHARPYSPSELVHREILPTIARLRATQTLVDAADAEIRDRVKAAGLSGIPEIDLGNGNKAQLVGRRLPDAEARRLGLKRGA